MNIYNKWNAFRKRPDFIAFAGLFGLSMLLVFYKIGEWAGQLAYHFARH